MNRRSLFWLPLIAMPLLARSGPAFAAFTPQQNADLARCVAYLNAMRTLKARFLQVGPDGRTSEGTAWIQRPGKLRFQYDPPSPLLLVAGFGVGFFHDSQLGQTTNFPISSTPLSILLADNITLAGDVTVNGVTRLDGQIQVSVVRTASPGDGSLVMIFTDQPLSLRQWSVIDAQRRETRVTLYNVQLGGSFDNKLFEFADPSLQAPSQDNRSGG